MAEIGRRLESIGVSPASLNAVIVTHEHSDHIRGVGTISRRFNLPVYMTPGTRHAGARHLGRIENVVPIQSGCPFFVGHTRVHPFSIPHDAADPVGLCLTDQAVKIGISTDVGTVTRLVAQELKNCHALVMEANHDLDMLEYGPYPWELKQRIKGRLGHLSNEQTCLLLKEVAHPDLQHIVLAHLSQVNNHPQRAYRTVKTFLRRSSVTATLSLAWQERVGRLIDVY